MRWDVFCTVIDNFGDIGVCWRLARGLAARGHTVRLWVDDASALAWMAPDAAPGGRGHPGIEVRAWSANDAPWPPEVVPGEVVIEAFGCQLPDAFVARMRRPAPPRWINLEYLSAEDYVERSHGLPSPVFSGPGAGLVKHFFYPGFTPRTGGLLREPGLAARQGLLWQDPGQRAQALRALGVDWAPGERVVSVFCYADAPVAELLARLDATAHAAQDRTHVLLTPGPAQARAAGWHPALSGSGVRPYALPLLSQPLYDTLLGACDLNFVRGEDSATQALWAARPHVWQIYPQDDGVHAGKLEAFMDRWMGDWPATLALPARALWRAWNGLDSSGLDTVQTLWHTPDPWGQWQAATALSSEKLQTQPDLVTQLLHFVTAPG